MVKYTLSNGNRIDFDGCIEAVRTFGEYPDFYLDTETGNVCIVDSPDSLKELVEKIGRSTRYRQITRLDTADYAHLMSDFLEQIIRPMADKRLHTAAKKAYRDGDWQSALDCLRRDPDGWIHAWEQYAHDAACDLADEWLLNIPDLPIKVEFEGCGNCALCELIRAGEGGDLEKLTHAFDVEHSASAIERAMPDYTTPKKTAKRSPARGAKKDKAPPCGLCGSTKKPRFKMECCDNWVCGDESDYVLFSYSRDICSRNHRRLTLCGYHYAERHAGDWKTCKKCIASFEPEMAAWYGTNEYNFEKHPNPPAFEPTHCANCGSTIDLGNDGYATFGGAHACEACMDAGYSFPK